MPIEHSILNFEPMIRKIKIDKIMNRPCDENIFTDYLELIKIKSIKDIEYINHLFLASLIFKNIDTNGFLSSSTIRSLIDI